MNNGSVMSQNGKVTGKVQQVIPYQQFTSGSCKITDRCSALTPTISCPTGTWQYQSTRCNAGACNSQYLCSRVDPTVCPKYNNIDPINYAFNGPPTVDCTYSLDIFDNINAINEWSNRYGNNDSTLNQQILPYFCSRPSTDTVTNKCVLSSDGIVPTICSRFRVIGRDGEACRDWASRMVQANQTKLVDATKTTFCQNNNTSECQCLRRIDDPNYRQLKQFAPYAATADSFDTTDPKDACWFRPCSQQEDQYQLRTSDIVVAGQNCDPNICQKITQGYNTQQYQFLSEQEAINTTICPINRSNSSNSSSSPIWLWILLFFILLILIGLGIFAATRTNSNINSNNSSYQYY